MKIKHQSDFVTTSWSGGETMQLAIFPETATVEQRNFDWRISSATVVVEESEFSFFYDYQRILIPLTNSLLLQHDTVQGTFVNQLFPLEPTTFDGSWKTTSKGMVQDINVIYKNRFSPHIHVVSALDQQELRDTGGFSHGYLFQGSLTIEDTTYIAPCFFQDIVSELEHALLAPNSVIVLISFAENGSN